MRTFLTAEVPLEIPLVLSSYVNNFLLTEAEDPHRAPLFRKSQKNKNLFMFHVYYICETNL